MNAVDLKQEKSITMIVVTVTVLTGIIGLLAYRDNKKHQKMQQELFAIDREIKLLQLNHAKHQAKLES